MQYLITGASSGIGKAVAAELAVRGHHVVAVARNKDQLDLLHSEFGDLMHTLSADLTKPSGQRLVTDHVKASDTIDGIVHCAGSAIELDSYQNIDVEKLVTHMKVHVAAPIALNNALREELKGCRIIFIDSYSAISPRVGWAAYSIVKAAAQMAARAAAAEITDATTIRVFPGAVRTPLVESVLRSKLDTPVVKVFKELESNGKITDASRVAEFITNVLITANDEQLSVREFWDFNNPDDQIF